MKHFGELDKNFAEKQTNKQTLEVRITKKDTICFQLQEKKV